MTTTKEQIEGLWNKVLFEILESRFVKEYIGEVKANIQEGKSAFEDTNHAMPYGFGKGCYYATKRALLEDAVYQFFEENAVEQSSTLSEWIIRQVKDELTTQIKNIWDVKDFIGDSFGRTVIRVDVDYSSILRYARNQVEYYLEKKTDQEIEDYVSKIETTIHED